MKEFRRFFWKSFKRFLWKSFKRFQTLSSFPCEGKSNCFGSHRCRRGHEFETFQPRKHFSNAMTSETAAQLLTSWVKMWFHPFPGWCHPPLLLIYNFPSFLPLLGPVFSWLRCCRGGKEERGGWRDPLIHPQNSSEWQQIYPSPPSLIAKTVLSGNKYIHCHPV